MTARSRGDIEYLYEVDLEKKIIRGMDLDGGKENPEVTAKLNEELEKLSFPWSA